MSQNNRKFRSENTLTKFRNFYNAANNIGYNSQRCSTLDENRDDEDLKDCNTGFVKMFNSFQERNHVYEGRNFGGVGMNSPIFLNDSLVSNTFFGYSRQNNNFEDRTSTDNDNFTFGIKIYYYCY